MLCDAVRRAKVSLGNCCSIQLSYGDVDIVPLYQRVAPGANLAAIGCILHKSPHWRSRGRHNPRHPLSQARGKPCVV